MPSNSRFLPGFQVPSEFPSFRVCLPGPAPDFFFLSRAYAINSETRKLLLLLYLNTLLARTC